MGGCTNTTSTTTTTTIIRSRISYHYRYRQPPPLRLKCLQPHPTMSGPTPTTNDVGANSDRTTIRVVFDHQSVRDFKLETKYWKVFDNTETAERIKIWACNEINRTLTFSEQRQRKNMWLQLLNSEGNLVRPISRLELLQEILREQLQPIIQVVFRRPDSAEAFRETKRPRRV